MSELGRERDLVLNPNEFAYVLDKTKGLISCVVGSYKMSLSTSDSLVIFNEKTKQFEEAGFDKAITTFITAPENWYIKLKNPAQEDKHPTPGTANPLPDLQTGKKVNIKGNVSFALYPGQMAKVIQGHRLHSNQYLLARVYDADVLGQIEILDENGKPTGEKKNQYTIGQLLVIKGTEVQFYIPPTGIEVIPVGGKGDNYIRDAVTLERLEYCILKDEQGNKKYIHGAAVVFPEPDETFVENPNGGYKFKAIELSDISGVYVKVIADYEENSIKHYTGEELFIRYPGNKEVLRYNAGINEEDTYFDTSRMKGFSNTQVYSDTLDNGFFGQANAIVEDSGFSRKTTYTKPRSITIDNKFDGVVSIDIWTGYAINVVSKNGTRKVITGAQTYLLEYDETLEVLELSTGRPKTTDNLLKTVYLRVDNNKISDLINVQTKDFVDVQVKVSYCVDFLEDYKDKWFSVENYVKYMTDRQRSLLKREARLHTIEDFYENASDIVRRVALNLPEPGVTEKNECGRPGRFFKENGMLVHDVEVLSVSVQSDVEEIINAHQRRIITKSLELSNAAKEVEVISKLTALEKEKADLEYQNKIYKLELDNKAEKSRIAKHEEIKRLEEKSDVAAKLAEKELQSFLDSIQKSELARKKEANNSILSFQKEKDALEIAKQKAYTDAIKKVIESISPNLIASMTSCSNAELMKSLAEAMGPYALATNESVSDVINRLLRGTSLEGLLEKLIEKE